MSGQARRARRGGLPPARRRARGLERGAAGILGSLLAVVVALTGVWGGADGGFRDELRGILRRGARSSGTSPDHARVNRAHAELRRLLRGVDGSRLPILLAELDHCSDPALRGILRIGIADLRSAEAADGLDEHIDRLLRLPPDPAREVELAHAFAAFARLRNERSLQLLERRLRVEDHLMPVLGAISGHPLRRQLDAEVRALLEHPAAAVRAAAARALALPVDDATVAQVISLALSEDDSAVRTALVTELGRFGSPRAIAALASILAREGDVRVREQAVEALIRIGGPRAAEVLERHATREPERRVRARARDGAVDILEGAGG